MPKVLIVDDELEARQFLSRSLADCGYAIREASDGREALKCLATEHPDVVITDLLMPVMDGFELALRIRADPDHSDTEVIFFTGRASPRQVQAMAETAGVAQIVTKPATIDELQGAVDAALHRKHPPEVPTHVAMSEEEHHTLIEEITKEEKVARSFEKTGFEPDHRFRVLFDRSFDAMLLLDDHGVCLEANTAANELLKLDRNSAEGVTLWDLTPPHMLLTAQQRWNQFMAAGRMKSIYGVLDGQGGYQELELSAVANLEPGMHLTIWRRLR